MASRRKMRSLGRAFSLPARRKRAAPRLATPRLAAPQKAVARRVTAPRSTAKGRWHRATHRGPAGARAYAVYVPPGIRRSTRAPLLVLLHGCDQSPDEFATATRFNELADRHGFLVAYPEQAVWHHQHRCWRWYEAAHQRRGSGEPAVIAGITAEVAAERGRWRVDPARMYVAGLSAGGAMALVLAATYPELYAAVGVHSAPAYRSAAGGGTALGAMAGRTAVPPPHRDGGRMPPTILFYGGIDVTVRSRNGLRVAEQWLAFHQAHTTGPRDPGRVTRSRSAGGSAGGRRYSVTRWYTAGGHKALEYWQVEGLAHAWSGGRAGVRYSDPRGPRASTAMWSFFAPRRLAPT